MADRSKLTRLRIVNVGPIGPEGLDVSLDNIVCLVGANNCGKSTVLRAYELALGAAAFAPERDLSKRADSPSASVEIWVHIPEGIANVAEKWKTHEEGLRLVRSRWEWSAESNWNAVRQTWDPELGDYSTSEKTSGLDEVFKSRLPKPFRIGTLDDPQKEHEKLLTLILQPVADRLGEVLKDETSALKQALVQLEKEAGLPVQEAAQQLDAIRDQLDATHSILFPDITVGFEIGLGEIPFDPIQSLRRNSHVKFTEWGSDIDWRSQGTGSQRALFWTMLQVRSRLSAIADVTRQTDKDVSKCEQRIATLQREEAEVKKDETKEKKRAEIEELRARIESLKSVDPEELIERQSAEVALPGYMLLIDEPEVALHPSAIRAACGYLYDLSSDPAWQVMLGTHSPQFIDPLRDHTTIVRLDRSSANPTPRTYRADAITFTPDERTNLKMLNRFAPDLAEMFFGQFPLLVEGDTEYACFNIVMDRESAQLPPCARPILVRARGKSTLVLIARMLRHFQVGYGILHDADWPFRTDGCPNGAWTTNESIFREVSLAREAGLRVVHRVSMPTFELEHMPIAVDAGGLLIEPSEKDKPWNAVGAVSATDQVYESVGRVFRELVDSNTQENPYSTEFTDCLRDLLVSWVEAHGIRDPRIGENA